MYSAVDLGTVTIKWLHWKETVCPPLVHMKITRTLEPVRDGISVYCAHRQSWNGVSTVVNTTTFRIASSANDALLLY